MKKLFGLGVFMVLALGTNAAKAESVQMVYEQKATIHVCPARMAGCVDRIQMGDKSYILDYVGNAYETIQKIVGNNRFHNVRTTDVGKVLGFVVTEKGHMPNPTVEFQVFKVMSIDDYVLPRGM